MTGFADLPNELILALWRQVLDPDAVESFALASKKVYALGSSFIKEHNELRARFSFIYHHQDRVGSGLVDIFKALLQNPRAALYVRRFGTDGWRSKWDVWDVPNDFETPRHRPYPEDTVELFRQSVKDSPLNLEDEIVVWLNALKIGNEGAIFSLILTMLPNVHSLSLHRIPLAEDLLFETIKRISESRDTVALSRLTEVRLLPSYDGEFEELVWVRTFARLPSVKSVEAWYLGLDCESTYHNYPDDSCGRDCYGSDGIEEDYHCSHSLCHERRLALPPRSSAITHLTFIKCSIETRKLVSFLKGMRGLESFEYHCTDTISKPEELVDALLAHGKRTLRKLCLRSDGQTTGQAITLANFEVINELDIAYVLLQRHLVHILPPSIEKVRLSRIDIHWAYTLDNDVLEITAGKAERLANLKELTVELLRNDEDCELLWDDEDCEDCELLLDGDALNAETITTMKQQCEDVGVRFSATFESPVPREWMDWYPEEAIRE